MTVETPENRINTGFLKFENNIWQHYFLLLLPQYFGIIMCEIKSKAIIALQNQMINYKNPAGKKYSPVYLKILACFYLTSRSTHE